jgi:hypothetical protein
MQNFEDDFKAAEYVGHSSKKSLFPSLSVKICFSFVL